MFAEELADYADLFILRELSLDCSTFYLSFSIIPRRARFSVIKLSINTPKFRKENMRTLVISALMGLLILALVTASFLNDHKKILYTVSDCSECYGEYRSYYEYDSQKKVLRAFVTVNCGSDEVLAEKIGEKIVITEKDYDGKLAKCLCQKEVRIFNVDELKVEFVDWSGNSKLLEKGKGFCGRSTLAHCEKDDDCKIGGCSSQLCMGAKEEIVTTCEFRECYDYTKYRVSCKCVNNMCQWI
ncbi:MAG: eight-cysteine-cluster domain-containing protein [Archaeoglobales archaeon]|nr:eight-cysteine-cluster domain-containing protein [Archaeoglobales archaeon]